MCLSDDSFETKLWEAIPREKLVLIGKCVKMCIRDSPRTDARVLSSAVAKEIGKNIGRLKGFEPTADFVEHIMPVSYTHLDVYKRQV